MTYLERDEIHGLVKQLRGIIDSLQSLMDRADEDNAGGITREFYGGDTHDKGITFGDHLSSIRQKAIQGGMELLTEDEVSAEVQRRRGGEK